MTSAPTQCSPMLLWGPHHPPEGQTWSPSHKWANRGHARRREGVRLLAGSPQLRSRCSLPRAPLLLKRSEPGEAPVTAKPKGTSSKCLQNCFDLKAAGLAAISSEVHLYLLPRTLGNTRTLWRTASRTTSNSQNAFCNISGRWLEDGTLKW